MQEMRVQVVNSGIPLIIIGEISYESYDSYNFDAWISNSVGEWLTLISPKGLVWESDFGFRVFCIIEEYIILSYRYDLTQDFKIPRSLESFFFVLLGTLTKSL